MDVFFDTEFTTIEPHVGYPALISIGCVADDGREFYAELSNTWQIGNCSHFVLDSVLPLLEGGEYRMTEEQCATRLKHWIEGLTDSEVILRCDAPQCDWPWIVELFQFVGCWPSNLHRQCGAVSFESSIKQQQFEAGLKEFWKINKARRHHVLTDAKSLRFSWKMATRSRY